MRYKVRIEGRTFEAEVGNVDARPIVVVVEGERYEVWPELLSMDECAPADEAAPAAGVRPPSPLASGTAVALSPEQAAATSRPTRRTTGPEAAPAAKAGKVVYAPIPGVVDSVAVRLGDQVAAGDPLCVVEAMKMKNIIRATRAGTVADVYVAPGQHVRHNDPLVEFGE
ncbi:MAG: acetyl-CoA carboxylase biotin carboxyl carrier protein subunit [Anaerolineae bacterium]|nr:acetyl-CoA carboxylase biotin carboxyl carrier protein subunit [Anaerolineae bacterium]